MKTRTTKEQLAVFLSYTNYVNLVNIKKLEFIFNSINKFALQNKTRLNKLEILEVACGNGGITFPLGSLGCNVRAFDINERVVLFVKARLAQTGLKNIIVSKEDGNSFEDGKYYDIVIASEVLEHVPDPFRFISNLSKRMKRGSYLVITVPNGFGPWELVNQFFEPLFHSNTLRHALGKTPHKHIPGEAHIQFFKKSKLIALLSQLSFDLVDFSNSDSFFAVCWHFIKPDKAIEKIDMVIADHFPHWCASGWYMLLIKT
ncbi:MAG: methyltransferase domain-containing protein [Candidatus Bathyarchaeia archaeon]|jgi:2-polyprenyl-3-methyl-5-hydroxy-6-metoxy-1,4-benzoquinol methylase